MHFGFLIIVAAALAFVGNSADTRPNIIFIFADDWGWNDVSYHEGGYLQTDFLDSLAKDGLILSSHYVMPTCTPSRAALLTGRYPANIGMQHSTISPGDIYGVPLEARFISDELQSYGYSTHMIGKWHLGFCAWEYTPLFRGFDSFSGFFLGAESYSEHNRSVDGINGFDLRRDMEIVEDADGVYSTYWHYQELSNLMQTWQQNSGTNDDKPFFLYLAWQNSHNPPEAPDEYLQQYKDLATGARRYFMGQTAVLDDVMEDFIDELKDRNLWDNTLIVFSSDNGPVRDSGDSAPLRGSKNTLWEGGVRVPAFVTGGYLPDSMRGQTTSEMIHVTDWFPTFLSLAAGDSAAAAFGVLSDVLDGVDVSSVLLEGAATSREEFLINVDKVDCESTMCGALRYQNYKMIMGGHSITSSSATKQDCFWTRSYMKDEEMNSLQCGVVPDDVDTNTCGCSAKACLFDIDADPCEYYDLSGEKSVKHVYDIMWKKLKTYYDAQQHPWKDIFGEDYDGADPVNHENFWSPWLGVKDLVEAQLQQYETWEFEQEYSGMVGKLRYFLGMGPKSAQEEDVMNDAVLWMGVAFGLFAIIVAYVSYRCHWCCCKLMCCRFECCQSGCCAKKTSSNYNNNNNNNNASDGMERNPLLGVKNNRYT